MKKSELTQLTQIIEHIVAKEVRKQLPTVIAEVFQNMIGRSVVTEQKQPILQSQPQSQSEENLDFKTSLRELFAGTPVMSQPQPAPVQVRQARKFTNDPRLNEVLNNTVSDLRDRERLVGAAAFQGGYSPALNMVPGFNPATAIMSEDVVQSQEPSFSRNIPIMPGMENMSALPPVSRPPILQEGQESTHAPLATLPEGISALDVKQHAPAAVKTALTRNYSQMMKIIDAKRKGRVAA